MATYDDATLTYDDVDVLYDGLPVGRPLSLLVGTLNAAEDLTADARWDSFTAVDAGTSARGVTSLRLERALADLPTLTDQALVRLIDHALHSDIVRAIVTSRQPVSVPGYDATDVVATDMGALLDDTWIVSDVRPAETLVARVTHLWTTYASSPLDLDDLSFVASIGGTLPVQNFAGVTLRKALEATIAQASASADYYVEASGRLHVFTSEANPPPFDIDAAGVAGIAPHDLSIDYDSGSYANRVYVQGATPAGSGFFQDDVAIAAAGGMVRTSILPAPDCETAAMALALGSMYLGRVSGAIARGSFSVTSPHDGWRAGQNVAVTSAAHGLGAELFRIVRVTTKIVKPGDDLVRRYTVEFGGARAGSAAGISVSSLGGGQVVSGQLGGASNVYVTSDGVSVTDGS